MRTGARSFLNISYACDQHQQILSMDHVDMVSLLPYNNRVLCISTLQGICASKLALKLVLVQCLKIRVASNVLLGDEDVGNTALVGYLLQGILNGGSIICICHVSMQMIWIGFVGYRTDLVELESVVLCAEPGQELLGGLAVRAVRLGENGYGRMRQRCQSSIQEAPRRPCALLPTALLSMISCALVFAADIVAGLEARVKKLRMKEMMGDLC